MARHGAPAVNLADLRTMQWRDVAYSARVRIPAAAVTAVVFLYAAGVGFLYPAQPLVAVAVALLGVLVAMMWNDASRLAVLAIPGVWLTTRVPVIDVSLTDVLATAAGLAST
jgi:hypothetical protein